MGKTKVEYTNHQDPKKIGTVVEVEASTAKRLLREGLVKETKRNVTKNSDAAEAKGDTAKGVDAKAK